MTDKRDDHGRRDDARTRRSTPTTSIRVQIPNRTSRPARSRPRRTRVSASRCPTSAQPSPRSSGRTPRRCTHLFATTHSRGWAIRRATPGRSRSEPNAGSSCLRSAHRTRSGRASVRSSCSSRRPSWRAPASSQSPRRRRRRRLVVVHGAARRRGNERLELRARLAVAVRGHSCDAALASRHKGSLANRILRTDVSPPRK